MVKPDLTFRAGLEKDWPEIWQMIRPVFAAGETYPVSPDISETDAYTYWMKTPRATYIAMLPDGTLAGSYYIRPNQPDLGDHVCNCGYIVAENMRGSGIASRLCQHSQQIAVQLGFSAMQYNLVVASNEVAVHVWQKNGMEIIGTIRNAFRHSTLGLTDAHIMYKWLLDG